MPLMMGVERTERRSSTKATKSNTDSGVAGLTIAPQDHAARFARLSREKAPLEDVKSFDFL